MLPVRCFTCGKVIAAVHGRFLSLTEGPAPAMTNREALDHLEIRRYCCRTHFITYSEDCTNVPAVEGEFVPGIATVTRKCQKRRLVTAR
jgi:DNA-directed RNA polymerase subunit N (RpoN/RPB10)